MNEILMQAVVECAAFLELSGDDVVNPDAAVRQLEGLASTLRELTPPDRIAFTEFVEDLARSELENHGSTRRVQFLQTLPENLGLRD